MTLRSRLIVHLALVHLALAAVAAVVVWEDRRWLLAVELLFALSLALAVGAVRAVSVPAHLLATGAELLAERDFGTRFRPVGDPEMDRLVEVYNAMADRLREERLKLEEQHFFLEKVLAASPAGIVTLDYDGRVSEANPSALALLQLGSGQAVGRPAGELPSPLAAALAALPVGESRLLPLAGRRRLKCSRAAFFDRGFPRTFFVIEELTEELRASERAAYEKLIRLISHEVNNSTGAVVSLLDSCRAYAGALPPAEREEFVGALGVSGQRLERLAAFIRGFAEVVHLPPPDLRPADVEGLLWDVVGLLRPELERRRIRVEWEMGEPLPAIPMDKNQIEQVLLNVLKNAVEAMAESKGPEPVGGGGHLTLSLGLEHGVPCLRIRDSGPGLSAEARAQLFTPFFSTKRDGRGLGLTLVQEILAQHRFDFALDSRPGEGCTFTVWFGERGRPAPPT